jgi:DNA-binding transcriptional MerR regulator
MLTIGQLAAFAGVTIRAVRHYHARGLLPEPERDASGYRRYDVPAVVELIRIRTLAEAGVPLSRVGALLQADPAAFARSVAEIDRDLASRIAAMQEHRRRVAALATGDGLALPAEVVGYLTMLGDIGVSERVVGMERDGWILLAARAPDRVAEWIAEKRRVFDDEEYRSLYLRFDRAFDWPPDDPRIDVLAEDVIRFLRRIVAETPPDPEAENLFDDDLVGLLDAQVLEASPAWQRLGVLVHSRGVQGWTNVRIDDPDAP